MEQRETELGAMSELAKAFWLVTVVERFWKVRRNLSSGGDKESQH